VQEAKDGKLGAIQDIFKSLNNYFFLKLLSFQGKKRKYLNCERKPQIKPIHHSTYDKSLEKICNTLY